VLNALAERGIRHLDMPLTPFRIWRALHDADGAVTGQSA
jgi:aerobic carbon-monoxide dehydrogenase large subunit